MSWSRRRFLSSAAALGLATTPTFLTRAASCMSTDDAGDRQALVVLQLSGGNDGLNTVVPFESDGYYRNRPTLSIGKDRVLKPRTSAALPVGFHPAMEGFQQLHDAGELAVIQGVGYANPSRSHFRSMDIWHTARPGGEDEAPPEKGWLGRTLEVAPKDLSALHLGDDRKPLALVGERHVPSLQNLDFVDFLATRKGRDVRRVLDAACAERRQGDVEAIRGLARTTIDQLDRVVAVRESSVPVEYPETRLAKKLRWVGQMVAGGYPSRVFYLSQGGYDTHAQQADGHANLLRELASGVAAFQEHLRKTDSVDRVTLLIFSEFGRRVRENASLGTDHGCAAPAFIVSGRVQTGYYGEHPSLDDLDSGDLVWNVDFRRLYATVLEEVLGIPSAEVLGGRHEVLPVLRKGSRRRV